jgi:phthalate 4,5-cis-dihydrodiol dehydrogenase
VAEEPVVRLGIVGLGIAARQVLSSIQETEGAELTAVCDVRPEELDRFKKRFGVATFTNLEDMCKHGPINAVWVATPNNLHAPHTIMAANHGKHVIVEKPMAVTMDEANEMVEAVERNGVQYVQGHSRIHRPYVRKIGDIIATGRLGKPIQINTWMYNDWIQRPWEGHTLDPNRGGGCVYRQGPHQFDVIRYLAGGLGHSVRATTGKWQPYYDVEGNYSTFVDFDDGPTAMASFNGYGNFDIRELCWGIGEGGGVYPEEKMLGPKPRGKGAIPTDEFYKLPVYSIEAFDTEEGRRAQRKQDFFGLTIVSCERGDIRQSPDGVYVYDENGREEVPITGKELRAGEVLALVEAVRENRPAFPDVRWGRATLEIVLATIESSRERKEIILKHQVPSPLKPALDAIPAATRS